MVADAPTATFTVDAGGLQKNVTVYALGMDVEGDRPMPRPGRRSSAWPTGSADFDHGGSIATETSTSRPPTAAS